MDHVDALLRLIEYDTSGTDGAQCVKAISYFERLLASTGCHTSVIPVPPGEADGLEGRVLLLAHRRAPAKPRLIIYGHMDVVPADAWPAFAPRRAEGRIHGRGAADMKGSLASLLGALQRLSGASLAFDLTVAVTMDEETHQMSQLRYVTPLLDAGPSPHVLSLDAGFGYVTIANLGLLQLDITVSGESVHSALAHLGRNAIEDAGMLMAELANLKRRLAGRISATPTHPSTGLPAMEPRLTVNQIRGGIARNVVPDTCTFAIDRRLLPEETVEEARAEIVAALRSVPGVAWRIAREFSIPSVPPCADPVAAVLANAIERVTGATGMYGDMLSGELPAAAKMYWGGDAFATGVIRPESHIHGVDEFVYESDLDRLVEVLARFLTGDQKEAA